jgi:hypothetical protein
LEGKEQNSFIDFLASGRQGADKDAVARMMKETFAIFLGDSFARF